MRAIQAFGSSSVLSLGGGSLSDVFHSGERGSAFGLFYLGPLIAPMIGPIIGGVLADRAGWRSTMWLLFGTSVVALLMVFFFLPETSRKQIDSTPALETKSDAVDASNVSRSNFYSSASSTHVASEISANNSESGHNNISDAVESEKEAQGTDSHINIMIEDHHHDTALEDKMEMEVVDKQIDAMSLASIVQESTENEKDQGNNDDGVQKPVKRKHYNPLRPLLCLREPTNALLVLFNALALGSQYCMNNTLPISFSSNYGLSESLIGVCFCAAGLGSAVGSLIGGRYSDYVMRRWLIKQELKRQRDEMDRQAAFGEVSKEIKKEDVSKVINIAMRAPPEVRLQSVWVGVFALPFGLLLYGWSVQYNYPIAVPVVGIFFLGFGMMMVFSSATTALVDANSDNNMASSAVACNSFARGVSGAIGGFTALPLEGAMGSGWLYTLWAILTIFGAFGLVLMVVKAKSWRERAAAKALDKV
ncbi:hypothetical protein BGZ46_005445 [Entomortierella lignicola]|nr:hypothetical protein BGZ46_005445 [Entomortierella lignicola]